jgi:hypothetical protein
MPKGPKGQKAPADVVANAVRVMRIATGEDTEDAPDDGKNKAAQALGRLGGAKGGRARSLAMTPEQRAEAARLASQARWKRKPD